MHIYEKLGVKPLINASEPYTRISGSLMREPVVKAMIEASEAFVDMSELLDAVCVRAAELTGNDAAFVTSGAAGGVVLSAAACMCGDDETLMDQLPDVSNVPKNEILIFDGYFKKLIPYWHLISLSGARLISVKPTAKNMLQAVNEKTAAVFLFPSVLFETDIPDCESIIPLLKKAGVPVVVDAAAQLPPKTNFGYYTKDLGADLAIFSGGKHIRGPQSTGLIVGRREMIRACRKNACPNIRIGRPFKTGKEELAGFITALELFVTEAPEERFKRQYRLLTQVAEKLFDQKGITTIMQDSGRLGTEQPLLIITLPEGKTGAECNRYARSLNAPVDIGFFKLDKPDTVFVNAYNLKENEAEYVAAAIRAYLMQ